MSNVPQMTVAEFLEIKRETAEPKELLDLIVAENERMRWVSAAREQEFKLAAECELDENFNPRPKNFAQLFRIARVYVDAGLAPKAYLDSPNPIAAVSIGIQYALRCGVEIMMFLQNSYPVNGKIGIESKLAISMLIRSGKIKDRPEYKFHRDASGNILRTPDGHIAGCTCLVVDAKTGIQYSQEVTWDHVKKEGWDKPKGSQTSKWLTLPEMMFQYRSGVFVMRMHYPDVLMGMMTIDELEDIGRGPTIGASSMEELTQHITQSLDRSPEQQATDGGSRPKGRKRAPAVATEAPKNTPKPELPEEAEAAPEPPVSQKKAAPQQEKAPEESAEQPADLKNIPDAELKEKIDRAVKYMKTMYGARCEGFDLNLIALSSSEAPSWAVFCKSVIEKQKPGWENYLQTDEETREEIPEDDASQEIPETSDQLPESIENPVQRPAMIGSHARAFEVKIQSLKQAKRIRDLANAEIQGHPELLPEEQNYLESLADRRAWYIEHGQEPAKERQIPE